MHRKQFAGSLAAMLAAFYVKGELPVAEVVADLPSPNSCKVPPYLQPGDTIGITTPAGAISMAEILPAVAKIREWGFNIKMGKAVGKKDFTLGGTDEERRADLQDMLDDQDCKAIFCARGGYGLIRIIDQLNFSKFVKHPKWVIGFSDISLLHAHLQSKYNIASIHSKMCSSFPADWVQADEEQRLSLLSIYNAVIGGKLTYQTKANPLNMQGTANGSLVGGNLRIIESLLGSASDLITRDKILFLEDADEYLYNIDRMFWSLKRAGKLSGIKGLIVGGFKIKPDDPGEEFGLSLEQIILEKVKEYGYPIAFDFPVGHQKYNVALRCGMTYNLMVNEHGSMLTDV